MLDEIVDALVLQAYGIEHACRGLSHARSWIALTRMQGGALYDDGSQGIHIHEVGKFVAIAKCARRGHHWVLQLKAAYVYFQITHSHITISDDLY